MKAVLLAGGKGRRLHPYTTNFPKPLMPVGGKPILETVLERLRDAGIKDIIMATAHLESLIRAFFETGEKFGVRITYSNETEPLGTAGPLNLVREQLASQFLLVSGDVLTDLDFGKLVEYHDQKNCVATVALARRSVHIDFGVVDTTDGGFFEKWSEKPTLEYFVSTGIYLFEARALEALPGSGFFNVPDLIQKLDRNGEKVSCYVHDGDWLDIGRPEDYEKACKLHDERDRC